MLEKTLGRMNEIDMAIGYMTQRIVFFSHLMQKHHPDVLIVFEKAKFTEQAKIV